MLAALKLVQLLQKVLVKLLLHVAYKSMHMFHDILEVCFSGLCYNAIQTCFRRWSNSEKSVILQVIFPLCEII